MLPFSLLNLFLKLKVMFAEDWARTGLALSIRLIVS